MNPVSMIRWEFSRADHHVLCAIRATPSGASYEVATVPLWDVSNAAVETFSTASEALRRHAAIATDLRDAGWMVAAYT